MVHAALDVITEIFQGIIAIVLVGSLGVIAIVQVVNDRPFNEPAIIAGLAGAAIGFYYGQRNQRKQADTISSLTEKLVNGGSK